MNPKKMTFFTLTFLGHRNGVFNLCLVVGGVFHLLTHTEAVLTQFFLFLSLSLFGLK